MWYSKTERGCWSYTGFSLLSLLPSSFLPTFPHHFHLPLRSFKVEVLLVSHRLYIILGNYPVCRYAVSLEAIIYHNGYPKPVRASCHFHCWTLEPESISFYYYFKCQNHAVTRWTVLLLLVQQNVLLSLAGSLFITSALALRECYILFCRAPVHFDSSTSHGFLSYPFWETWVEKFEKKLWEHHSQLHNGKATSVLPNSNPEILMGRESVEKLKGKTSEEAEDRLRSVRVPIWAEHEKIIGVSHSMKRTQVLLLNSLKFNSLFIPG